MNILDYQMSIIQAKKDGKVIQSRNSLWGEWCEWKGDEFNFCVIQYRVKPEKIVRYIPIFKNQEGNHAFGFAQTTEEKACNWRDSIDVVKVEYEPK
jgi:hypothetical protein